MVLEALAPVDGLEAPAVTPEPVAAGLVEQTQWMAPLVVSEALSSLEYLPITGTRTLQLEPVTLLLFQPGQLLTTPSTRISCCA